MVLINLRLLLFLRNADGNLDFEFEFRLWKRFDEKLQLISSASLKSSSSSGSGRRISDNFHVVDFVW